MDFERIVVTDEDIRIDAQGFAKDPELDVGLYGGRIKHIRYTESKNGTKGLTFNIDIKLELLTKKTIETNKDFTIYFLKNNGEVINYGAMLIASFLRLNNLDGVIDPAMFNLEEVTIRKYNEETKKVENVKEKVPVLSQLHGKQIRFILSKAYNCYNNKVSISYLMTGFTNSKFMTYKEILAGNDTATEYLLLLEFAKTKMEKTFIEAQASFVHNDNITIEEEEEDSGGINIPTDDGDEKVINESDEPDEIPF